MKRFLIVTLMLASLVIDQAPGQETSDGIQPGSQHKNIDDTQPTIIKSKLKILFVGRNPEIEVKVPYYLSGPGAERMPSLKKERMASFKALLDSHFENVRYLVAEDYKVAMSDDCDVTVFDEMPPPIETVDMGTWKKKLRMPADFDRPALLIELGPSMLGRNGVGLRLDHL